MDSLGFRDTPILPSGRWHVHDPDRPQPAVVGPGSSAGATPSDAIVLFDGHDLKAWANADKWAIHDGAMIAPPGYADSVVSRQSFGDVQLHLEFRSPNPPTGTSQERGNSGVIFMQRYEVQVLDGYQNRTYADGTVGAVYGWKPPLVNPSRRPGEWQSYDIVFERPHFGPGGKLLRPAFVTVLLNGVLVQNHQPMLGKTQWRHVAHYEAHDDSAPLVIQDHDSPVAFRNIWVRPLPPEAEAADMSQVLAAQPTIGGK
jgi:hypothetical protein